MKLQFKAREEFFDSAQWRFQRVGFGFTPPKQGAVWEALEGKHRSRKRSKTSLVVTQNLFQQMFARIIGTVR